MFRAFGPFKALPLAVPKVHQDILSLAGSRLRQCVVVHSCVCMAEVHSVVGEVSSASCAKETPLVAEFCFLCAV